MKKFIKIQLGILIFAFAGVAFAQQSTPTPESQIQSSVRELSITDIKRQISELKLLIDRAKITGLKPSEKEALKNRARTISSRISSLQTQITAQNRQIYESRPTFAPTTSLAQIPGGTFCYGFLRELRRGASGNEVVALREVFNRGGLGGDINSKGVYSDQFDAGLEEKVKKFQRANNLTQSGWLDSATRLALNARYRCPTTVARMWSVFPQNLTYKTGEEITFQWIGEAVAGVKYISLIPEDPKLNEIIVLNQSVQEFPLLTNSYSWKIPSTVPSGKYKVRINRIGSGAVSNSTITISNPDSRLRQSSFVTNKNIYLLYPIGGENEKLKKDSLVTVSWAAWTTHYLTLQLKNVTTGYIHKIVTTGGNTGNNLYTFKVPSLPEGEYKLQVLVGGSVVAESAGSLASVGSPVRISSVSPRSGALGTTITINGSGFSIGKNYFMFACEGNSMSISGDSANGTSVSLTIPKTAPLKGACQIIPNSPNADPVYGSFTITSVETYTPPVYTETYTPVYTETYTPSYTATYTQTYTATPTYTPTQTASYTQSYTPVSSPSPSPSPSYTPNPSPSS